MTISPVNVLLLGQTGVGKSSLLNYLLNDRTLADSNTGYPVTAKGFHVKKGTIGQLPIHAYDSWGIEMGAFDEWMKTFKAFLNKSHGKIDCLWFCINSNSHRIQATELEIMNYLISKDYDVTIIFTKVSPHNLADVEELKLEIESEIPIIKAFIKINSIEETLMSGNKIEAFGATELTAQLVEAAIEKNMASFKSTLKNNLLALFNSGGYTPEELKDYLMNCLTNGEMSFWNELAVDESSWLLNTRTKISQKTSPLFKKVTLVKSLVKRTKGENANELIDNELEKMLNDLAVEQKLAIALKQELVEG